MLLSKLNSQEAEMLIEKKNELKSRFIHLLNFDEDFNKAITSGTGDKSRVKKRFAEINNIIQSLIIQ